MRKLKHLLLILILVPLMFAQYEIPIENLLTNSLLSVYSQADANAGIAALIYDTGAAGGGDIPDVGDAVTGGASGATGKIMSMTIATGTFAGNNATGVIQLGSTTGCFNDDETLAFTDGETAVVNHPDGAVGADKIVKNGAFVHDVDPPNDWIGGNVALLSTEAGGKVGNCVMATENGANNPEAYQNNSVEEGKIYNFVFYVKQGTESTYVYYIYDVTHIQYHHVSDEAEAGAAWTQGGNYTFEVPAGCTSIRIGMRQKCANGAGTTIYFDEITVYEITPGCTEVDTKALDGYYKNANVDIYRQHNDGGTYTKDGSFYALKYVPDAASRFMIWPLISIRSLPEFYQQFAGRTVTFGCWIKANVSNHARLRIEDSFGITYSAAHSGGGTWEWIEITRTIDSSTTLLQIYLINTILAPNIDGTTIVYISQPMLAFQSSIGTGNYSPRQHEWIYFEKYVTSNKYENTTGWSDTAYADLNLEADSNAIIPKGAKAIMVHTEALDAGSGAVVDVHIHLRKDATSSRFFTMCWGGRSNGVTAHLGGFQPCDINGDIDVEIEASGVGTLDITRFRYSGVQVTD